MNSFDIFDTLITRWYKDPESIFDQMSDILCIPNFKHIRKTAQIKLRPNPTLENIYKNIQIELKLDDAEVERIKQLEIKLELDLSAPIMENVNKLKPDDILISDMYLPHDIIISLLNKNKIAKYKKLYLTPNGKNEGTIWKEIKEPIKNHTGDNKRSDYAMPLKDKIAATLYTGHNFTDFEKKINSINRSVSLISRLCRLQNPYEEKTIESEIWNEACRLTIPFNIFASLSLNEFLGDKNFSKILFSNRDCYYMKKIYDSIFSKIKTVQFQSSRRLYYYPTKQYIEYCKDLFDTSLVVDLFGSSKSFNFFIEKNKFNNVFLLLFVKGNLFKNFKSINTYHLYKSSGRGFSNVLEKINYVPFGSLFSFEEAPLYADIEYNKKYALIINTAIDTCVNFIQKGFYIKRQYNSIQDLSKFLNLFSNCFFSKHMNHTLRHNNLKFPDE